jgi:hypothetical protein
MTLDCWGPTLSQLEALDNGAGPWQSSYAPVQPPKGSPVKLIVSRSNSTNEIVLRTWWGENMQERAVIFPDEYIRKSWVNSFEHPDTRELAAGRSFAASSNFAGRDDIKEYAVAHANTTLPRLLARLGLPGALDMATGTSAIGGGW